MKNRSSHAKIKDNYIFALYGQKWSANLKVNGFDNPEDSDTCGIAYEIDLSDYAFSEEDVEYIHVWLRCCAEILGVDLEANDDNDIYELLSYGLEEGFKIIDEDQD